MPALTESEARARADLLAVDSYDVSIDLTETPVLSRTVIRFRCARPGAASFADLTARAGGPPRGRGPWRFAPMRLKPLEFVFCAGPLRVPGTASPPPHAAAGWR